MVDIITGDPAAIFQIGQRKRPAIRVYAHHGGVISGGQAGVLQFQIILVRPESRQGLIIHRRPPLMAAAATFAISLAFCTLFKADHSAIGKAVVVRGAIGSWAPPCPAPTMATSYPICAAFVIHCNLTDPRQRRLCSTHHCGACTKRSEARAISRAKNRLRLIGDAHIGDFLPLFVGGIPPTSAS
jgi:hypothetical protein